MSKQTGFDRDAFAFLYFNSDIIKDIQNIFSRNGSPRQSMKEPMTAKWAQTIKNPSHGGGGTSAYEKTNTVLERKSIVFKILKNLHNYTIEENIAKNTVETILLTGGQLQLG